MLIYILAIIERHHTIIISLKLVNNHSMKYGFTPFMKLNILGVIPKHVCIFCKKFLLWIVII